ncbi:Asp23/Gls24 family envelope stress response protein [Streptomyces sp. ID03-2B]|uniref:Asp23/Gls24 family envelope stress response protein n=1 Tax=Streptomyces TaxID=1883 RepID=UPI001C4F452F|nr:MULTISPECIES: Asp23/Gls24 family envelope stress response protein [unclassified Streptomyces]MDX3589635.1 Asp23/Gls24 family envelope stress response protein [Streptomyces sp. ID03-2B]QXR01125.1 Asp23/Gls24 family envelope stress response protein [Streptomyces sp. WY228]WKN19141.1 Asp23/Gls24 family envelope stress response protein [Streptomyces sp. JUS-F4]
MTADTRRDRLAEAAAEAARGVPGVAFLRPGVADLLRTRITGRTPLRTHLTGNRTSGVRVSRDEGDGWHLDIRLVLRSGHRVLDVTRLVQKAVLAALPEEQEEQAVSVRITVTGVV